MARSKLGIIVAFCAGLFVVPMWGWSPCVVFAPPDDPAFTVGQFAMYLIDDGATARYRVVLIPRAQIRGNADEFGILVPTPSVPTFDLVGSNVFRDAGWITQPVWRNRSSGSGCGFATFSDDDGPVFSEGDPGVDVISQQTVGAFDVVVLASDNASALIAWLDVHGYGHGVTDDAILDDYIRDGWVFTAMRIDGRQLSRNISLFDTEPAALIYETDVLEYPLRLAAISASRSDATRVVIYTIASTPMTFDGARVRYANRVSQRELDRIRETASDFGAIIAPGQFVTKLERDYGLFEAKDDFELTATDEFEFQEVRYASLSFLGDWSWLLVLCAYLAVRGRLPRLHPAKVSARLKTGDRRR